MGGVLWVGGFDEDSSFVSLGLPLYIHSRAGGGGRREGGGGGLGTLSSL